MGVASIDDRIAESISRLQSYFMMAKVSPAGTKNFLNLRAILPSVAEKDVKVSVQNNQLVIEGERKASVR
jgi:HSP20 family molecular chaperone IbpA